MKPFILFQFITQVAAFARQMFLPTLFILSAATLSFGQNNLPYDKAKLDLNRLTALEAKASYVTDIMLEHRALRAMAANQQSNLIQNPQYAKARIDVSHLAALEDKAASVIDVNVDRRTLRLAEKFFKNDDPDEKKIKELIAGIDSIMVKVFEFEREGEYQPADYQMLKTQIDNNPGWIKLAGVRSKKKDMINIEVSIMTDENDNLLGVAIIAAEKEHLAVINIVGTFDLAKIRDLSGKFSIPDLELEGLGVVKRKTKERTEEKKPDNQ